MKNLSELIKECGMDFCSLYQYRPQGGWCATSGTPHQLAMDGATPEEAVANLLQKLNER